MNQIQKTRFAWAGCIVAGIAILSGAGWIFRVDIANVSLNFRANPGEQVRTQVIPRTTSYLGRIRTAEQLLEKGQNSRAAIELAEAITERPEIIRPYILLGETHIRARDFGKITGLIQEIDRRFPGSPEINVLRARELIAREEFKAAQAILKNTSTEILDPSMQLYQATLASLQNDHKTAKALLAALDDLPVRKSPHSILFAPHHLIQVFRQLLPTIK